MTQDCDYLLIGGGVGAYNAAKRLRKRAPESRIVMISADDLAPYDLPPLSKDLLKGVRAEADLVYPSLESQGLAPIDQRLSTTVTHLNAEKHVAETDKGDRLSFGAALLATGGAPIRLNVPGASLPQVHYLRSAEDCRGLRADALPGRRAVVIGAGFIGVEAAASLRLMGLEVTVLEAADRVWPRFADAEMASRMQALCEANGVSIRTGERLIEIDGQDAVTGVRTQSGLYLPCDLVCVGIGIRPNTALAEAAGLQVDNGIVVDQFMRTSAPSVYAVGDVVNYPDPHLGRRTRAEHWGHAEYSGQIAAMNMLGTATAYDFLSYAWSDVFDWHIESAGHAHDHDERVVRGNPDTGAFTTLYFRQKALVAYTAVNGEASEFPAYRRLIRGGKPLLRPADLGDPAILARSLVAA